MFSWSPPYDWWVSKCPGFLPNIDRTNRRRAEKPGWYQLNDITRHGNNSNKNSPPKNVIALSRQVRPPHSGNLPEKIRQPDFSKSNASPGEGIFGADDQKTAIVKGRCHIFKSRVFQSFGCV
jgi:hypothetical protein